MAVDLGDLVEDLKTEVSPPGEDLFPNATEDDWISNLRNGFWEARLDNILGDYSESEGVITPVSGTTDLSRLLQQVIVIYAGMRIVRNALRGAAGQTTFRAHAGPVEYETGRSAGVLREIMQALRERKLLILNQLSSLGVVNDYYIDAVVEREQRIWYGNTNWVGF